MSFTVRISGLNWPSRRTYSQVVQTTRYRQVVRGHIRCRRELCCSVKTVVFPAFEQSGHQLQELGTRKGTRRQDPTYYGAQLRKSCLSPVGGRPSLSITPAKDETR